MTKCQSLGAGILFVFKSASMLFNVIVNRVKDTFKKNLIL